MTGPAQAQPAVTATLVGLHAPPPVEILESLSRDDDVSWSARTLVSEAPAALNTFDLAMEAIQANYLNADFLTCMVALQRPDLDLDQILAAGRVDIAARLLVLSAACAEGAGDLNVAEAFLRRAFLLDLDLTPPLRETTPELQAIAERIRTETNQLPTLEIPLQTRPTGLPISIDGRPACSSTPCSVTLRPGPHLIQASALGYEPRQETRAIQDASPIQLTLEPASAPASLAQLRLTLNHQPDPSSLSFTRAASTAFASRVVLLLWQSDGAHFAAIYDRATDHVVAQTRTETGPLLAAQSVYAEWRGDAIPPPLVRNPWFWTGTVGVAILAGVGAWFFARPENVVRTSTITFPAPPASD